MVVTCDINFDENKTGCYFAGQLISGNIVFRCNKEKDVKAIQLQITGYAQIQWSEKKSFNNCQTFDGREDYLSSTIYLVGSENSTKTTIPLGIQTYTFACQLPTNCPSSFEGKHGHVRYTVKVSLLRPWKFDQTYIKAFTVLKLTDLNFESPQIRIPSNSETYRTFCCAPCLTQPLKMELKIPQAGYVPGQNIPVQALITNNSRIAISEIEISLVMVVRYISEKPTYHHLERINVSKVRNDGVPRNCTKVIKDEIHIPATPPTCLHTCNVIQIVYNVEMDVKMKCFQKNQLITIPVIIGNIPLANNTSGLEIVQQQPRQNNRAFDERPIDAPYQFEQEQCSAPTLEMLIANLPPPSYEESYHMLRSNIAEREQNACEFTPLYPVYKIPSPTFEPDSKSLDKHAFVRIMALFLFFLFVNIMWMVLMWVISSTNALQNELWNVTRKYYSKQFEKHWV